MKKLITLSTLITALFVLNGCGAELKFNSDAPEAASAGELIQKCQEEIASLEQSVQSSDNPSEKAAMCEAASLMAVNCHKKAGTDFLDDPSDTSTLGNDFYHETTNYLCYCENAIAAEEIGINAATDPEQKFALLNENLTFSMDCQKALSSELHDQTLTPRLGSDDLGMTTNLEVNCESIMEMFKNEIDAVECEDKKEIADKMKGVEDSCMQLWQSSVFDQSRAPKLLSDHYGTASYYEPRDCEYGYPYLVEVDSYDDLPNTGDPALDSFMLCMRGLNSRLSHVLSDCHAKYGSPEQGKLENTDDLGECYTEDPEYQEGGKECREINGLDEEAPEDI